MMNKAATIKTITKIAAMKPKKLVKYTMEDFKTTASKMSPEDIISVFVDYKPLDNGNEKLAKGIFSFSILPVVSCDQACKGCYDVRSLRYPSVRLKRVVNTLLAASHQEWLRHRIQQQILRSRTVIAVRIHVGGDFFSAEYAKMWKLVGCFVIMNKPAVKVYTYTKTKHTAILQSAGINVVKSTYELGHYNFAEKDQVILWAKQYGGKICPATLRDVSNGYCGAKCTLCMTTEKVFFVLH